MMQWERKQVNKEIGELAQEIHYLKEELAKAKKETAKEVLSKVDYESNGQTKQITDLLRKQYGVEVE